MARFLLRVEFKEGLEAELPPEESHHLAKVLRMETGSELELVNGRGQIACARLTDNSAKKARCLILSVRTEIPNHRIHIVFALPKSSALDFIIHRCTEMGVASFQPLFSQHSQRLNSWNEERWQKVIIEVAKQCQESFFPVLHQPVELKQWLRNRESGRDFIYCDEEARSDIFSTHTSVSAVDLLIGSEGGWSNEEREWFKLQGKSMGLGKNRLRAETAAMVALTLLKKQVGELA